MNKLKAPSARVRRVLYLLGVAALGVAAVYGFVTDAQAETITNLLGAALLGLAAGKTSD